MGFGGRRVSFLLVAGTPPALGLVTQRLARSRAPGVCGRAQGQGPGRAASWPQRVLVSTAGRGRRNTAPGGRVPARAPPRGGLGRALSSRPPQVPGQARTPAAGRCQPPPALRAPRPAAVRARSCFTPAGPGGVHVPAVHGGRAGTGRGRTLLSLHWHRSMEHCSAATLTSHASLPPTGCTFRGRARGACWPCPRAQPGHPADSRGSRPSALAAASSLPDGLPARRGAPSHSPATQEWDVA